MAASRQGPKYQTQPTAAGVLFWWQTSDRLVWSVFVPRGASITQPMAAALLGKDVSTVIRWCERGLLKATKVAGKPALIPLDDVLARLS